MESKKALITGITGFVGSHLADYIIENYPEYEVYGLKRWRSPLDNIAHCLDKIKLVDGDLRDSKSMAELLKAIKPEKIFHLAAQSFVPTSFSAPFDTFENNAMGTMHLLDAVRLSGSDPIIHICSTSEVYGVVPREYQPINENTRFMPQNPYGISKCTADLAAKFYFDAYKLKTIITRAFSHTGPRRGAVFAASSFAKQIAEIEKGKRASVIKVGNLDSIRTWMDVRDTVEAYWLVTEKGVPGEAYVVGGDKTMSIREVLNMLLSFSPMKDKIKIETDPALLRPADILLQVPDCTKLKLATGWRLKIPVEKTFKDLLDYWRGKVT